MLSSVGRDQTIGWVQASLVIAMLGAGALQNTHRHDVKSLSSGQTAMPTRTGIKMRKDSVMGREDSPPQGNPTIRTVAMPADTNPAGDIFGGWLMSQMDLAAGNIAALTSGGRSATIAVDAMIFHRPVKVGDEVSLYATLVLVGRTSMTIHVDAWRRPRQSRNSEKVTEANFTFVALDAEGQPTPIDAEQS